MVEPSKSGHASRIKLLQTLILPCQWENYFSKLLVASDTQNQSRLRDSVEFNTHAPQQKQRDKHRCDGDFGEVVDDGLFSQAEIDFIDFSIWLSSPRSNPPRYPSGNVQTALQTPPVPDRQRHASSARHE
jgi:hypothetical protein